MSVRVRYAPSPTGRQHIGGMRTALFDYFLAKSQGGTFVLRIEDTDQERFDPGALQDIYDTFSWLGIHWDEGPDVGGPYGPYVQSERTELYRTHVANLVKSGHAYPCFCSAERLAKLREEQSGGRGGAGYDRHCRNLTPEQVAEQEATGIKPVIRFKVPLTGTTGLDDMILGRIERENQDVSPDPILLKSDGYPTYHLANVIDDHEMKITHILRGQEWIPSGPLHVLLYDAFGWEPPAYCHLPIVTGEDGQKLSKRHGATRVVEFRNNGYLPEALINYVSLLGWAYDDTRQIFSKADLERLFSLEKLNKSPAVFDYKKLEWFNGIYIREMADGDLAKALVPFLSKAEILTDPPAAEDLDRLVAAIPLVKERLRFLSDASEMLRFLYQEVPAYTVGDAVPKKMNVRETVAVLEAVSPILDSFDDATEEDLEAKFRELSERLGTKLGNVMMPLRVAVTGSRVSPPLIGSIRILGAETAKRRVRELIDFLLTSANHPG